MSDYALTRHELRELVLGIMRTAEDHTCPYCGYQFIPKGRWPTIDQAIGHVSCLGTDGMKAHHAAMLLEQVS